MQRISEKILSNELQFLLHDIKSPLTNIGLNLETLQKSSFSVSNEFEGSINSAVNSLNFINRYIQSVTETSIKSFFEPSEEIEFLLSNYFICEFQKRNIRYTFNYSRNIKIYGNRFSFQRSLYNILTNSIEALNRTSKLKREICILCQETPGNIVLMVKDSGKGLSREEVSVKGGNSTKRGNYGLGLEIVNQFVAESQGEVKLYNDYRFTTIKLTFPKLY